MIKIEKEEKEKRKEDRKKWQKGRLTGTDGAKNEIQQNRKKGKSAIEENERSGTRSKRMIKRKMLTYIAF